MRLCQFLITALDGGHFFKHKRSFREKGERGRSLYFSAAAENFFDVALDLDTGQLTSRPQPWQRILKSMPTRSTSNRLAPAGVVLFDLNHIADLDIHRPAPPFPSEVFAILLYTIRAFLQVHTARRIQLTNRLPAHPAHRGGCFPGGIPE